MSILYKNARNVRFVLYLGKIRVDLLLTKIYFRNVSHLNFTCCELRFLNAHFMMTSRLKAVIFSRCFTFRFSRSSQSMLKYDMPVDCILLNVMASTKPPIWALFNLKLAANLDKMAVDLLGGYIYSSHVSLSQEVTAWKF